MRLVLGLVATCLPLLAAPAFADCADEIQSTMARLARARPVLITSTIERQDGLTNVVTEIVQGAMHTRQETGGVITEHTLLGDRAWRNEGGRWTELPAETAAAHAAAFNAPTNMGFYGMDNVECLGTDTQTSLQSYRLTYFDSGVRMRAALQVDPALKLPITMETSSEGDEKWIMTGRFTYDADITVEAPVDGAAR